MLGCLWSGTAPWMRCTAQLPRMESCCFADVEVDLTLHGFANHLSHYPLVMTNIAIENGAL